MLIGAYLGIVGDKRRVAVPKIFLSELGESPVIAKWYEDCLVMVSNQFWNQLLTRLTGGVKSLSLGVRDIERFILGSAFETEPDSQGRIVIPQVLTDYAGIQKELMFVGLVDRIEIWPKEIWDKKSQELAKTTKEYIESIGKND